MVECLLGHLTFGRAPPTVALSASCRTVCALSKKRVSSIHVALCETCRQELEEFSSPMYFPRVWVVVRLQNEVGWPLSPACMADALYGWEFPVK